jgi:hypothetical protein
MAHRGISQSLLPGHTIAYRLLSGRSKKPQFVAFTRFLATLIVINVVAFVLHSYPSLRADTSPTEPYFSALEAFSSTVFGLEYAARLWTAPEARCYRLQEGHRSPSRTRLHYAFTVRAMVDLVSWLPFFVKVCFGGAHWRSLGSFAWIRIFRLFRVLKLKASAQACSTLYRIWWYNSEILAMALFIGVLLLMLTSTFLWYLQPPGDPTDDFSSIPSTMYLCILMLTGQGIPDGILPWYTKVVVVFTALFSVPVFGKSHPSSPVDPLTRVHCAVIPASMLTWGFEAEAARLMQKKRELRRRLQADAKRRATAGPDGLAGSVTTAAREEQACASSSESESSYMSDQEEWDGYEEAALGSGSDGDGGDGDGGQGGAVLGDASETSSSSYGSFPPVHGSPSSGRSSTPSSTHHTPTTMNRLRSVQLRDLRGMGKGKGKGGARAAGLQPIGPARVPARPAAVPVQHSDDHRLARIERQLEALSGAVAALVAAVPAQVHEEEAGESPPSGGGCQSSQGTGKLTKS